jgi:hypothetical protein
MYCHEIATLTNAATSQSSVEAQLAKNAKMRVMYMYQSIIFEAIVGSECRYRLLLVFQSTGSTVKTTHGHQGTNVQHARGTQEMISYVRNDVLYYIVSSHSNKVGYITLTQYAK